MESESKEVNLLHATGAQAALFLFKDPLLGILDSLYGKAFENGPRGKEVGGAMADITRQKAGEAESPEENPISVVSLRAVGYDTLRGVKV